MMKSFLCMALALLLPVVQAAEPATKEPTNAELATATVKLVKDLSNPQGEFKKLVGEQNKKADAERSKRITALQQPVRKSLEEVAARLKKGATLADFPGLVELGEMQKDPESGNRTLDIYRGVGTYEDGTTLHARYFRMEFDAGGKLIQAGPAPAMQTR
jgi:hypothetical protein